MLNCFNKFKKKCPAYSKWRGNGDGQSGTGWVKDCGLYIDEECSKKICPLWYLKNVMEGTIMNK